MMRHTATLLPPAAAGLAVFAWGAAPAARATVTLTGGQATVPAGRAIDDDVAAAGDVCRIAGRVNGDLAAAGSSVVASGAVSGDVLAAGRAVTVQGAVGGSVRAAGTDVVVAGPVSRSVTAAGGTILLPSGSRVGRNASLAGGRVTVLGPVARDLDVAASQAAVGGTVGGSVRAYADRFALLPGAVVRGDLDVYGPNPPNVAAGARVLGRVTHHPQAGGGERPADPAARAAAWLRGWLFRSAALFLLGGVVLAAWPRWFARVAEAAARQAGPSLLYGLLAMAALPVGSLLIGATLVGLPLALSLLALYGAALLAAGAFVAYPVGTWLLARLRRGAAAAPAYARLGAGCLALSLLASLPLLGGLAEFLILLLGSGALLSVAPRDVRASHDTGAAAPPR